MCVAIINMELVCVFAYACVQIHPALHFQFKQREGYMEDGNNKVDADSTANMKIIFSLQSTLVSSVYIAF